MSDKEYIGEDGLRTILKQIKVEEMRLLLSRPCESDRVQLFRRGWTEILGQLLVPCTMADERPDGDGLRFRQLFVRRVNIWRQTRINSDIRQTIGQIVTDLEAPSGEVIEAVLLLEGYPATDLFDFLGRQNPVYNLTYASRP